MRSYAHSRDVFFTYRVGAVMGFGDGEKRGATPDAFAAALRDAINARPVTLSWLQRQLRDRGNRVSMATLSYWRSGARRPEGPQSLAALADIEDLLCLDTGALSRLLRPHRTGPLGPQGFPLEQVDMERAVREVYAALGATYPDPSRELTVHSVTDVDADGEVSSCLTRSIVQSTSGVITAIPVLDLTPGVPGPPPLLTAVAGGRVAARYSHPNGEAHGALIELDVPLEAPDTAVVEWSVQYEPGHPSDRETGHALSRQARELLVWTRFHPDAVPDWCDELVETAGGTVVTALPRPRGTSVHQVRRAFGPGALGLRWGYGPRDGDQPG